MTFLPKISDNLPNNTWHIQFANNDAVGAQLIVVSAFKSLPIVANAIVTLVWSTKDKNNAKDNWK